jgi:transposase-like protein
MPHRNAPLTETGRLRLARCVVEDGWPVRRAAERFQVSHTTAARWAARYRQHGPAGMADRSSRPHASPARTPARTERRVVKLRVTGRLGPARIAFRLGLNPATVHKVLTRYGCPPLAHLDRATGAPVRRYERARPGELVHVDIKKLGNIPDGGGWRTAGRAQGKRNARASTPQRHNCHPVSATATCTPPSTITPAWPTPRSWPMSARKPPPASGTAPRHSSPLPGSPSSGS